MEKTVKTTNSSRTYKQFVYISKSTKYKKEQQPNLKELFLTSNVSQQEAHSNILLVVQQKTTVYISQF